ncbi:hypothetical protein BHE74_00057439 [Ensete ventricosum]|nr:hypothetical protein BHE74_00057439 [Ensete ventricosum]
MLSPFSLDMLTIIILGCLTHAALPLSSLFPHLPLIPPPPPPPLYILDRPSPSPTCIHRFVRMAISGFEGFEKRLELHFSGDDPLGLRGLCVDALDEVLDAVHCTVVSAAGNRYFDAYILSESSLFVYPYKIIVKTCGTTQLLRSIPLLLRHAADLGLRLRACRYSRGCFIFPDAQPFPHSSFGEEVIFLDDCLPPTLCFRKASVLPSSSSHSWHVYSAATPGRRSRSTTFTVEVCMTDLDITLARRFFRKEADEWSGDDAGSDMTASTEVGAINPRALVCSFAFHPCGYSMNSLDRDRYSTIHVTPEDRHSYASFECVGRSDETIKWLRRALDVFRPGAVSVSLCMASGGDDCQACSAVADVLQLLGFVCRSQAAEEFPGTGTVTYQTFVSRGT